MMKTVHLILDGKEYIGQIEEIGDPPASPGSPVYPPVARSAVKTSLASYDVGTTGTITAPFPGRIISIPISVGNPVKAGDVVVILESMKMENEIYAAADGTIQDIFVEQEEFVSKGDALLTVRCTQHERAGRGSLKNLLS